ncbi:MAG TPA: CHASE domain-containing protein, partial [Candidatus Ozemobacteraceae bacterium]|nr:CHASE domain-containing protein [Candidatus Ozemobacteraceae bacterium]
MYRANSGKSLPPLLLLLFGMLVTCFLAWSIHETDRRQLSQKFESEAAFRSNIIRAALGQFHVDITTIRSFFNASVSVSSQEFCQFVTPLASRWMSDHPHFSWVPRVPANTLTAVIETTGRSGIAPFSLFCYDANGNRIPAPPRDEYHPILYYDPHDTDEKLIGYDTSSDPLRRSLLEKARDSGVDLLTTPVPLLAEQTEGVLLVAPVYSQASPPATVAERRRS